MADLDLTHDNLAEQQDFVLERVTRDVVIQIVERLQLWQILCRYLHFKCVVDYGQHFQCSEAVQLKRGIKRRFRNNCLLRHLKLL